jgi:hypothetical protein
MKKLYYIITFILISMISFQPINNFILEKERVKQERFIQNYLSDKSYSIKEVKKMPKRSRPDLKFYHDFLMMRDPNTNTIPYDKILDVMDIKKSRLNSLSYLDRKTEINWTERGPSRQGGRTRAIMLDGNYSSNQKVWAAGVGGGLWSTTNITSVNASWTKVSDTWDNLEMTAVASDPNNPNIIYVGSGEKSGSAGIGLGIWKTSDGGSSWTQLSSTQDFRYIDDLLVRNESGQSVIYSGGGRAYHEGNYEGTNGLWRSTDGGSTWTEVLGEITEGSSHHPSDLELDANNRLWVGTRTNTYDEGGGQIFYSDNGTTWTASNTDAIGYNRTFIETYPGDANILYAMMEDGTSGLITWMAKSLDNGASWTQITIPTKDNNPLGDYQGSMDYWGSLGVDPNDPNTLYVGGFVLFKSTDSGSTWTQLNEWYTGTSLPYVHADQHNIIPIDSNNILFTNDGGVFLTTNGGTSFNHRNNDFNTTQFYSTAIHPSSDYIIGGTQDNGTWKLPDSGIQVGTEVTGGDGGYVHIDQSDPSYQFTSYVYNRVYRSTNGGSTFNLYFDIGLSNGSDSGYFINPSIIDSQNKAFYSTYDNASILRQSDYTLLTAHDFIDISLGSGASAFKLSPHTNDVLFVGTAAGRVFKITDANTSSYAITEISPASTNGYISSIDIGENDNQILITLSNYGIDSVFETVSGGGANSWSSVEGDLPDMPVRWGLYNRNNFNQVVIATEVGVWVSDDISDSSPTWNPSNDGLANVRVDMLAMNNNGTLSAGTHGRGMFSSPGFTSTVPLNAAFTPNKTSGSIPVEVSFLNRSTGNPSSYSWDFGDGNTSSEESPVYTYNTPGNFSVSLTINDGSSTNTITKDNIIFATTVQDTLWSDGFESCFESRPLNGRENYDWLWRDANEDNDGPGCFSSSYNNGTTGLLSYDEDKGIGFGNAASAATNWDDWYISPEIWLRPGVENLAKFYATSLNISYTETFDVMLSPSGGNQIEDFTVTLDNVTDQSAAWNQYTYDLSQWAGTKVRIAIHHKSNAAYYEFYDLFVVTAAQLTSDGSPAPPHGLTVEPSLIYEDTDADGIVSSDDTWTDSEDSLSLFWNRNGEPDFVSYNVYASQVDDFSPSSSNLLGQGTLGNVDEIIPTETYIDTDGDGDNDSPTGPSNTTYINQRSFGVDSFVHSNLNQGEQWYYKVGAIDSDGNETISEQVGYLLDNVIPTAGTFTINDIEDSSYLRSTSEVTVTATNWTDNTGISYYVIGIGSSNSDTSADIVAFKNVGKTSLSLTGLSLNDYTNYYAKMYAVDGAGNVSSLVTNGFTTYSNLLGDYDSDWDVDVEDLNSFVNAWPSVDIGPATGSSPYLTPNLDSAADINDVSVFTRNWQWTKAQGRSSNSDEDKKINPIDFPAELFGNQIKITLPDNITAGRFEIINKDNIYQFSIAKNNQSMIVLENNDSIEQTYEFEFGRLSKDEKEIFIYINGDVPKHKIEISYKLFSEDGTAGNGLIELGTPEEFKLYQNYPNPFSNQTTFQYDVAEQTSIKIYIYNTLGQLVKTIDRGENGVGTHTVEWDGKNDDGDTLSSGVYFYQLRTKDFNKTMKMLFVK